MKPAKFVRIPRSFFNNLILNTSPNCSGWLVTFVTSSPNKLHFKELEYPLVEFEIEIPTGVLPSTPNSIAFVDSKLNETGIGDLMTVFDHPEAPNFEKNNPDGRFFFVGKADIAGMWPSGNVYYFSQMVMNYGASALFDPNNSYPAIKIEVKADLNFGAYLYQSNNPIQAKYIIAPPCPPEWNPAFSSVGHIGSGSFK